MTVVPGQDWLQKLLRDAGSSMRGDRMRRVAGERKGARRRLQIGKAAVLGVLARGCDGEPGRDPRRRPVDDLAYPLAVEQCERIDKDKAADPLARHLGGAAQHHAARAGAGQHDVVQILVEQQLGDLLGMALDGDAGAQLVRRSPQPSSERAWTRCPAARSRAAVGPQIQPP